MSIDQYPKLASAYRYLLIRGGRLVKGIDPDLAQTIHDHLEAGNS